MEGIVLERKALHPIRVDPFDGKGWMDSECAREVDVKFPVQDTKTLSSLGQGVLRMFQADHLNGTVRTPSTLS